MSGGSSSSGSAVTDDPGSGQQAGSPAGPGVDTIELLEDADEEAGSTVRCMKPLSRLPRPPPPATRSCRLQDPQTNLHADRCRKSSAAAEPLDLVPQTPAMLKLMLRFSSTLLCACGVGQSVHGSLIGSHQDGHPPRKGCHVVCACSSDLVQNTTSLSSDYDFGTSSTIYQVLILHDNHPRARSTSCTDRTDPTQVNMREMSGSYTSQPGKHV